MQRHQTAGEEGYTIIIVALVLFVFLGFCALAVDVGIADSARTSAQRAADAAALAGAFTFVTNPTDPQPATAINRATVTAQQNKVLGTAVAAGDVTVTVDTANRRVTVAVVHAQPAYFARAIGRDSVTVSATAIAEASISATGTGCLTPIFIPNTALFDPGGGGGSHDQCEACTASPRQVLVDRVNGVPQVTSWAMTQIQNGTNQFTLKPQDPHHALRPGDFYLIDVPGYQPGDLDTLISTCITGGFCAGNLAVADLLTGNHVGKTRSGIQTRIGCPNIDAYVGPGQYQRPNGGPLVDTSRALISCPIWDVCNATIGGQPFCPAADVPGGTQVSLQVVGFALVFVEGFRSGNSNTAPDCNGNDAVGRIINVAACSGTGGGGGGINPNETGPFAIPVRLVRTP